MNDVVKEIVTQAINQALQTSKAGYLYTAMPDDADLRLISESVEKGVGFNIINPLLNR